MIKIKQSLKKTHRQFQASHLITQRQEAYVGKSTVLTDFTI